VKVANLTEFITPRKDIVFSKIIKQTKRTLQLGKEKQSQNPQRRLDQRLFQNTAYQNITQTLMT
jgi:hypothetical protein